MLLVLHRLYGGVGQQLAVILAVHPQAAVQRVDGYGTVGGVYIVQRGLCACLQIIEFVAVILAAVPCYHIAREILAAITTGIPTTSRTAGWWCRRRTAPPSTAPMPPRHTAFSCLKEFQARHDYTRYSLRRSASCKPNGFSARRHHRSTKNHTVPLKADLSAYPEKIRLHPQSPDGQRLRPEALGVTVGGKNIWELCCLSVSESIDFFNNLSLSENEAKIAAQVLKEIRARLKFYAWSRWREWELEDVSSGSREEFAFHERAAETLSGGEAQRIRLATQIGSALTGVMYILDEPSIGLHQRDNQRLIDTLTYLRDQGNTVIVVEHDEQTLRTADFLVDIGPGAGENGLLRGVLPIGD